ncbi:MAG TPA: hypothetical protein VL993_05435 [Stellaceae bacterium]|nr:hypothetical protein [Stellaceae bacterium]
MRPIAAPLVVLALGACSFPDALLLKSEPAQAKPATTEIASAAPTPMPPPVHAVAETPAPALVEKRRPFVVIHFETPGPDYAQSLYEALKGALERKPGVAFDLVAVTRSADDAQRNLADVYHTVIGMGVPADRLSLSAVAATDDGTDEVWIYVR